MDLKIIYEDKDLLVVDKPAGIVVFPEGQSTENTIIDLLVSQYPGLKSVGEAPRYGIVHRLDKDTSGILLVAKSTEALIFFQKQFSAHTFNSIKELGETSPAPLERGGKNSQTLEKKVEKRYIALVQGIIKTDKGEIKTLLARSPSNFKKQTNYSLDELGQGRREAVTEFTVIKRFQDPASPVGGYTLLEALPKTGRKHQIRAHLAFVSHPITGDKLYGFKNSKIPEGLQRQFLHAAYLKITMLNGEIKEFDSKLPQELQTVLDNFKK